MTTPVGGFQEVAAAELIRLLAHELRQPLSTIGSVAYYLALILPHDEKVHEHLDRLQQLVEQSSWILSNGQQLSEPLHGAPEPIDIEELITEVMAARAGSGDVPFEFALSGHPAPVAADPGLVRALIENLLTLFRLIASEQHPARLITAPAGRGISIEIATLAPGFRSEAALGPGSTLSLECARRIVDYHHGAITLAIDPVAGVRMTVLLP